MQIIRAEVRNFRLLKDLELDFSLDSEKSLTVIRAANESGKTTCKTALLWGFYGNAALPGNGRTYPLFPSDLKGIKQSIEVSVEIDFESEQIQSGQRGREYIESKRYRLQRSCIEYSNDILREDESVSLFELNSEGTLKVPDGRVSEIIENCLPQSLKDVYFTDGDSAMSFIEAAATQGVKRKRVSSAIKALLGLDLLESTNRQLGGVAKTLSAKVGDGSTKKQLEKLNDRISGWEEDLTEWENEREVSQKEKDSSSTKLEKIDRDIEDTLKLGDKEKLVNRKKELQLNLKRNRNGEKVALEDLSKLINSKNLSAALVSKPAIKGKNVLDSLSNRKQLPRVNIPILEELLDQDECFCGADLSKKSDTSLNLRKKIENKITESREADRVQEVATSLFYSVRSESFGQERARRWLEEYGIRSRSLAELQANIGANRSEAKKLEVEIDAIGNTPLIELRELRRKLQNKMDTLLVKVGRLESKISDVSKRKSDALSERSRIEGKVFRSDMGSKELSIARLVENVFQQVYEKLINEELKVVSKEMNRIFLGMIGSDPEQNRLTLITESELTDDFDILVYGPNRHKLDPDQDLNGASRRAITLAFILALTKVSRVEAPNVIDTPLGMMSGFVKRSVLSRSISEGSQIVLFLTHDEINGVEDILDDKAGKVYTLTNPAHYPRMLANEPTVSDSRIVRCECDHRSFCKICKRIELIIT